MVRRQGMDHGDISHFDCIHHLRMLTSVQGTNLATSLAVIIPYWTLEDTEGEVFIVPRDDRDEVLPSVLTALVVSLVILVPALSIFFFTSVISS